MPRYDNDNDNDNDPTDNGETQQQDGNDDGGDDGYEAQSRNYGQAANDEDGNDEDRPQQHQKFTSNDDDPYEDQPRGSRNIANDDGGDDEAQQYGGNQRADDGDEPENIPDENPDEDPVDLKGEEAQNVTDEEKKEIGMMVAKQLIAQLFNNHNKDTSSHMTHEHVHTEEVDNEDSGDDKTLIRLTTADARGHATSVEAKLDTGAGANLMSADICEILGLPHEIFEGPEEPPSFTVGSGQQISPLALAHLHYKIGTKAYSQGFHVMETLPHDLILGGPFLLHSHLVTINMPKAQKSKDFLLFDLDPKAKKKDISAFKQQRQAERGAAAQARALQASVPPKKALPVRKK